MSIPFPSLVEPLSASKIGTIRKPIIRAVEQPPRGARKHRKSSVSGPTTPPKARNIPTPLTLVINENEFSDKWCLSPAPHTSHASTSRNVLYENQLVKNQPRSASSVPIPSSSSVPVKPKGRSVRPLPRPPLADVPLIPNYEPPPYSESPPITNRQEQQRSTIRPLPSVPSVYFSSPQLTSPPRTFPRPLPLTPPETSEPPPETPAPSLARIPETPSLARSEPPSPTHPEIPETPSLTLAEETPESPPETPPLLTPIDDEECISTAAEPPTVGRGILATGKPDRLSVISSRSLRRIKGAAVAATDLECSLLANLFRQLEKENPGHEFCEDILARTQCEFVVEEESTPFTTPSATRRNTFASIVTYSDGSGYEESAYDVEQGEEDEDEGYGDDCDDESLDRQDMVIWDWVIKDGVMASSVTSQPAKAQLRFSKKWLREKNGCRWVEDNYEAVLTILRKL
ncbi:hypothetical protein FA15DRAFT_674604 [Coprinopsis marcescibilis]|uniref:Uncharacterized protein n=1 Tax=Coprinopsis marcescibilis TaxID=230819 RepID=A0A5C3KHM4_COPMA|nr:hypothetical protein FA15DRAFT_674604 [Coprinopsis marcescibilis]